MWNWILNLFGYANDWTLVWTDHGIWQTTYEVSGTVKNLAKYNIHFSAGLNKYRLKISGHKPEEHTVYLVAKMQLIHFNKIIIKREG
jgi:hypothetical protein